MALGTSWASGSWATDAWAVGAWADAEPWAAAGAAGGTSVGADGVMGTIFLDDATVVPGDAIFIQGIAHSPAGKRYVCLWPTIQGVSYNAGRAVREDGAQTIILVTTVAGSYSGFGLSDRGEQYIAIAAAGLFKDGTGIKSGGELPVSDAS